MKKIVSAFFLAAIPFLFACTKSEIARPEQGGIKLVPKVFSATIYEAPEPGVSSKGSLGEDGKTVQWAAGDSIAVFDDVNPDIPHVFVAQSSGVSTQFTGSVSDGSTVFYAVYPYSAYKAFDADNERFTVEVPQIQYAVEDGFDPRGCIAGAYLTDSEGNASGFNFKLVNGLLKFSVDYDDVVGVTFSNTSRKMSGYYTFDVQADQSGKIANVGDSNLATELRNFRYDDVSLRNADGKKKKKGAVYYVVSRQSSVSSPFASPSVTLIREGGKIGSKSYSTGLVVARKAIRDFGSISGLSNFATDRYTYYQAGFDIVIGGKVFNKAKFGDAQLKTDKDNSGNIRSYLYNAEDKVTFLAPGTNYTCGSVTAVANVAVLANEDENVPVTVNNAWNINSGSIAVYGLDLNIGGSIAMSSNTANATADAEYLVFDHCSINGLQKNFWAANKDGKDYIVKEFVVTNCVIGMAVNGLSFFNINSCNHKENCKKLTYTNNVMYATTGATFTLNLLNCDNSEAACTGDGAAATATVLDIDVQNNLFVNMVSGNLIKYNRPKSLILKNNVEWDTNNSNVLGTTTKAKLFKVYSTEGTVAELSGCYAHGLTEGYTFTYSDNSADALMQSLGITDNGLPDAATLFSTAPAVAGGKVSYTFASDYSFIGPQ